MKQVDPQVWARPDNLVFVASRDLFTTTLWDRMAGEVASRVFVRELSWRVKAMIRRQMGSP
jgi:hypothetical protein